MKIRKAKVKDIDQIASLEIELLKYHQDVDKYFAISKKAKFYFKKNLKKNIYSKNHYLLVTEENNKIIGFALGGIYTKNPVYKINKISSIDYMFVDEKFRNTGISKKFMLELKNWFKEKKIKHIELVVHLENELGIKTWKKYGFKEYMVRKRVEIGGLKI